MKTMPSLENAKHHPNNHLVHTNISRPSGSKATDTCTEAISFTKIKKLEKSRNDSSPDGPVQSIDCTLDFAFEKNRIKAIENTELFVSISTTVIGPDTQALAVKQAEKNLEKAVERYKVIDLIAYWMRNVAIAFTLISSIGIIVTFFGVLFLSLNSVPVQDFILWLSLEAMASLVFMYISVKVTGINRITLGNNQRTFKLCLIFIIVLAAMMIIIDRTQSIGSLFKYAKGPSRDTTTKKEKLLAIVLLSFFFVSLAKILATLGYLITWTVMHVMLNRINSEQNGFKGRLDAVQAHKGKL